MIRSVRNTLSGLLATQASQLDDEMLHTFVIEAEAIINSRPLTYLEDQDDPIPLSPSQLLTMKSKLILAPPGAFVQQDLYCRRRWRRIQYLADQFWHRWRREYLPTLNKRSKWQSATPNVHTGDVVLLQEDDQPRSKWPLAKVINTHPSKDGAVRKVTIKTADGQYERPVQKLVLLVCPHDHTKN
jgi:hypothetical protein